MTADELLDLQDLLASKGWAWFMAYAEQEWGQVGFAAKVAGTVGDPNLDPKLAVDQLRQATVARDAVWRVLNAPKEEIARQKARLIAAAKDEHVSRRGGL